MENQFRPLSNEEETNNGNGPIRDAGEQPPPRSIDDYLESAYLNNNRQSYRGGGGVCHDILQHWRYYIIFLALGIANSGDSAEMGCTNYILSSENFQQDILKEGEDDVDFGKRGAAIAGAHFAGMIISGLLSGVLADVWGRRSTLLSGLMCNTVVGILSALARNATELCILRFACGVGLGMVIAGVVTMAAEMSPPTKRGRFMTLVASCYTLGFLYTSFWALVIFRLSGSGNWRLFMFMNALPTIVAATLVTMFVPESPRFYLSRGKLKEAVHTSNIIASRIGYVDQILTEEELRQYLFQAKRIGGDSYRGKDAMLHENEAVLMTEMSVFREVCRSLGTLKEPFANGLYKTSLPLQGCYFSLTLVTGEIIVCTHANEAYLLSSNLFHLTFYICDTMQVCRHGGQKYSKF